MSARSASLSARATLPGNLERVARGSGLKARAVSNVADAGGDSAERALIEGAQRDPGRFADLYQAYPKALVVHSDVDYEFAAFEVRGSDSIGEAGSGKDCFTCLCDLWNIFQRYPRGQFRWRDN